MKLLFHPLFKSDLDDAVEYHNLQREGLGDELRLEVEQVVSNITKDPERHRKVYNEVRRAKLSRFKLYSIRYQCIAEGIYYLSLFHSSRHPNTGRDRN